MTVAFTITFGEQPTNDFGCTFAAEMWLAHRGFSVGRLQRGAPRGVLLGDYDIQKWRNLDAAERAALDGTLEGDNRHGPLRLTLTTPRAIAAARKEALALAPSQGGR